jgi:hypothetical protein
MPAMMGSVLMISPERRTIAMHKALLWCTYQLNFTALFQFSASSHHNSPVLQPPSQVWHITCFFLAY